MMVKDVVMLNNLALKPHSSLSVNLSLPTAVCVHCMYTRLCALLVFHMFEAYEVLWLSGKPHLNHTIADNLDPVMRLFVRALFL